MVTNPSRAIVVLFARSSMEGGQKDRGGVPDTPARAPASARRSGDLFRAVF
jgi:hypothetical protein